MVTGVRARLGIVSLTGLFACGEEPTEASPWSTGNTIGDAGEEAGMDGDESGDDGAGSDDGAEAGGADDDDADEGGADDDGHDAGDDGAHDDGGHDDGSDDGHDDGADDGSDDGGDPGEPAGSCGMAGQKGDIVQVDLGGADRWYYVGAPASDEPLPMVVAFHGDEGHPDDAVTWFWSPVWEDEQSFILVMTKCPGCSSWYTGDQAAKTQYLWDVLEDVAANHNVDVNRIYAIGYSGGSSFLADHGLEFQDVFAGIQWHCGGGWTSYVPPPKDTCKVDGRFVIATDDFLWDNAKAMESLLLEHGHEVEFIEAACSGHCCHTDDLAEGAWAWFQARTKCDGIVAGECAAITDLP